MKHLKIFESYNFFEEIENIDYSTFDITDIPNKDMFDYIYYYAPETIKNYINSLKDIDQRKDYHPEGSVYNHTKAVTNRIAKTKDINLILSAFLHDTGKDRTEKIEKGVIMHPGHEVYSEEILNTRSPWREWIRRLGGNPYTVKFIIGGHMKMKFIDNNRKIKKWFDNLNKKQQFYLNTFNSVDYGGF